MSAKAATTNVTPALELKNVGKSFGNVVALRDVSLAVYTPRG